MADSAPPKPPAPKPAAIRIRAAAALPAGSPGASTGTKVHLNKRMAELGICSRREADDWIVKGWVRVDGAPAAIAPGASQLRCSAREDVTTTLSRVCASADMTAIAVRAIDTVTLAEARADGLKVRLGFMTRFNVGIVRGVIDSVGDFN